jgi:hypothetical protein
MTKRLLDITHAALSLAKYRSHIWLPSYISQRRALESPPAGVKQHAIITLVDHFEPSRALGERGVDRVWEWCGQYLAATNDLRDDDGRRPQHTWFYRYDYPNFECLRPLSDAVFSGAGEIEFHLHHGNDTAANFANTINQGKIWFGTAGAMLAQETGERRFAYIAGNWALANGQGDDRKSGVDSEIALLRDAGCYADFTFPAFGEKSQPRMANKIYYATHSSKPKCYDKGVAVQVGKPSGGDLLIFQGPLYVDLKRGLLDYAAVESYAPYYRSRIENWLNARVSISGRPEWTFIKLHTHGMQSAAAVTGNAARFMYEDILENLQARGVGVHFATAREAYNIVKAAEAGCAGDPGKYRDYLIPPPVNRKINCSIPCEMSLKGGVATLSRVDGVLGRFASRFADGAIESIEGDGVSSVKLDVAEVGGEVWVLGEGGVVVRTRTKGRRSLDREYKLPLRARVVDGASGRELERLSL